MNITIKKSSFQGFGTKKTENGIYFGCNLSFLNEGGVRFYDKKTKNLVYDLKLSDEYACGNVYSFIVEGISGKDILYRQYSDKEEYPDPFSYSVCGNESFGDLINDNALYSSFEDFDAEEFLKDDKCPLLDFSDTVMYLCHVRGGSMLDKAVKKKGTFAGLVEKIPYLKKLGVTTLQLMPCYEYIENKTTTATVGYKVDISAPAKVNYWGFCDAFYFSPKKSFSSSGNSSEEFAYLIKELHKNNMELLMMMYYPEGNDYEIISSSLRYYVTKYHVDGFRIMGNAVDVNRIVKDPFLSKTKLIFENCDISSLNKRKNSKYKNVALIRTDYSDKARGFLKGDEDKVGYMSFAVRENNREFAPVRLLTDYNGFTLNDLVSYSKKHNEDNGEDNTDGTNYNYSWNCGAEGETKKTLINKLRFRQAQNAMLLTLLCQGVPQILAGDEILNSAQGNNNPWCQDNEIGWISPAKTKASKDFLQFTQNCIAFRKRHKILHQSYDLKLFDYMSCKLPDVSFHGEEAFKMNQEPVSREFSVLYAGDYAKQYTGIKEDSVLIIYNMHWEDRIFSLPVIDKNSEWYKLFSTDGSTDISFNEEKAEAYLKENYIAKGRSITVFLLRR